MLILTDSKTDQGEGNAKKRKHDQSSPTTDDVDHGKPRNPKIFTNPRLNLFIISNFVSHLLDRLSTNSRIFTSRHSSFNNTSSFAAEGQIPKGKKKKKMSQNDESGNSIQGYHYVI